MQRLMALPAGHLLRGQGGGGGGDLLAGAQARASPDFRDVVFVRVPQGRDPGLGGPVHGRPVRAGRGGRAGAGGTGASYVRRRRLPPEEPARCLPPRPRGGAAPSRFSQLLPTPPTAGEAGREPPFSEGGKGRRADGHISGISPVAVGQSPGVNSSSLLEASRLVVLAIPTWSLSLPL